MQKFASVKSKSSQLVSKPSLFNDDDDEGAKASVEAEIVRSSVSSKAKVHDQLQKLAADDPSIFQYDGVYDEIQSSRQENLLRVQKSKSDDKPKYVQKLREAAVARQFERELVDERNAQRERQREGEEFGDKESFVTSAFKQRLVERQVYEEKRKLQDFLDAKNSVEKKSDLHVGFYSNLLKNTAMGGQSDSINPVSANAVDKPKQIEQRAKRNYGESSTEAAGTKHKSETEEPKDEVDPTKFARKTDDGALEAARARALARKKERKILVVAD